MAPHGEPSLGQVYSVLLDIKQDVGGVKHAVDTNASFTLAVSRKVDTVKGELDAHKTDTTTAHGAGVVAAVEAKQTKSAELSATKIIAALAALELIFHVFGPKLVEVMSK